MVSVWNERVRNDGGHHLRVSLHSRQEVVDVVTCLPKPHSRSAFCAWHVLGITSSRCEGMSGLFEKKHFSLFSFHLSQISFNLQLF